MSDIKSPDAVDENDVDNAPAADESTNAPDPDAEAEKDTETTTQANESREPRKEIDDSAPSNDCPGLENNKLDSGKQENSSLTEPPSPKQRSARPVLLWMTLILLLALAGGTAYVAYLGKIALEDQSAKMQLLQNNLDALRGAQSQAKQAFDQQQQQTKKTFDEQINQLNLILKDTSQRVAAQGKRLRAMSDTSREDWLLAEAEYLLKLANQRIRIERSSVGAEALLDEADGILRDLDDPNLHSLRRAIAKDLAALRLVKKIDVEGIYLQLLALTGEIPNIPVTISAEDTNIGVAQIGVKQTGVKQQKDQNVEAPKGGWETLRASWGRFLSSFDQYIQIDTQREKPLPLLPVKDQMYLQQNMRLMLERAQLALLREQQNIYQQSLQQADEWLLTYYNKSAQQQSFSQSLQALSQRQVVQALPDISASLLLIHEYIEDLHNLKGIKKSKTKSSTGTVGGAK